MPLYFAYGSNMDEAAMHTRCPNARPLGRGRLARHRFVLMGNGYASVHRDSRADVHGVLWDLPLSDVGPLDRYEEVEGGLYVKEVQPILREGAAACRALVYLGTDTKTDGTPPPGYMESVVTAAKAAGLPARHLAMLEGLVPGRRAMQAMTRPLS